MHLNISQHMKMSQQMKLAPRMIQSMEYQQFQRIRDRHQAPRSVEEVQAFVDALYGDKKPGNVVEYLIADRRRENATS